MSDKIKNGGLVSFAAKCASILGIIQGFGFTVLSLLSILIYHGAIDIDNQTTDNNVGIVMYRYFLTDEYEKAISEYVNATRIIDSTAFSINSYIYLLLSFGWFVVSSVLCTNLFKNKWNHMPHIFILWSILTMLISILDIILMSLLAYDYNTLSKTILTDSINFLFAYAIVMSIAAKGYMLLLANIFYAIVLAKYAKDIYNEPHNRSGSIIDAYATSQRPPWDLIADNTTLYDEANAPNFEYSNKAFLDDNELPVFGSRSQSFKHIKNDATGNHFNPLSGSNGINRNGGTLDNNQFILDPQQLTIHDTGNINSGPTPNQFGMPRLAKIGKQTSIPGRRTPPQNIPPPHPGSFGNINGVIIPEPDYTPPASPKAVKSALRPKSNYVL